jgi:hypothetical protein
MMLNLALAASACFVKEQEGGQWLGYSAENGFNSGKFVAPVNRPVA